MLKTFFLCATLAMSVYGGDVEHFKPEARIDLSKLGFVDQNGKKCTIGDFKGKLILVDFWVTWCGPCRKSLPELKSIQKHGNDKGSIVVIPCNLDDDQWPNGVYAFMHKNSKALEGFLYYRPQLGKSGIASNLGKGIDAFPTTLLIDRNGKLAAKWSGYGEGLAIWELNQLAQEQ